MIIRIQKPPPHSLAAGLAWLAICVAGASAASGQEVVAPEDLAAFEPLIADSIAQHLDAVRADPADFQAQQQLGLVYLANGAPALAERVFTICIKLDGDSAPAHYYRALTHYERSDLQNALEDLQQAAALEPDYVPLHWRLGFWLLEDGRLDESEASFRESIDWDSQSLPGAIGLALVDLSRREHQSAADRLEALIKRGEKHPYIYHLLASAYRGLRRLNEAMQASAVASGQRPAFDDPWDTARQRLVTGYKPLLAKSHALLSRREFDQSLGILDGLRSTHPDDPVVLNYYFYAYSRMGQHDRARDVLLDALRLEADYLPTHLNLSTAYERLGQPADAIRHADRAVELNPRFGPALLQRGRLALLTNDAEGGADYLKRAIECGIHDADHRIMYGRVLANQQKWREAATVFQQVAQNNPDQAQAWAGLAISLAQLGQLDPARTALNRARQLDPDDEFVVDATQRVQRIANRGG